MQTSEGVISLLNAINNLLYEKHYNLANMLLQKIDVPTLSQDLMCRILDTTAKSRKQLPIRATIHAQIKEEMQKRTEKPSQQMKMYL
jgi:hypothetical protein